MNNQLFIGKRPAVHARTIKHLQKTFCQKQGCGSCRTCTLIDDHRHHNILWLAPQKNQYTRVELDGITQKMAFALDPQEQFVFVIEDAELLSAACANSLLKAIEEPPQGYSFILLAERADLVLPTIRSRCLEYICQGIAGTSYYPELCALFQKPSLRALGEFATVYDRCQPSEQETFDILDQLLLYWRSELMKQLTQSSERRAHAQAMLDHLCAAYQQPPMPGSAKLFWRTLFVTLATV